MKCVPIYYFKLHAAFFLLKDVKYKLKSKLIYPLHRIFSELKSNRIRRVNFI